MYWQNGHAQNVVTTTDKTFSALLSSNISTALTEIEHFFGSNTTPKLGQVMTQWPYARNDMSIFVGSNTPPSLVEPCNATLSEFTHIRTDTGQQEGQRSRYGPVFRVPVWWYDTSVITFSYKTFSKWFGEKTHKSNKTILHCV